MMNLCRTITTAGNLIRFYGLRGFVKGIHNKLHGREMLDGVHEKKHRHRVKRILSTSSNLYKQFGFTGLLRGICNKVRGKNLLEGLVLPADPNGSSSASSMGLPKTCSLFEVSRYLMEAPCQYPKDAQYSCTVVIPVYNGLEHLERLLPNLEKNTPEDIQVLFVNDASPDPRIMPYIRSYIHRHRNWCVIENQKNVGFVATVNFGMSKVKTDYAIWLNTDTEVPANWIPKMIMPLQEGMRIATTTPFTNSGVYFSFPRFSYDNQATGELQEINQAFDYVASVEYGLNEIPSGMGYCMGVNMACWKEIGKLDYHSFGKGYGEENDWCFRALQKGWRHLLVPNLYVHHFHGGSFLSEEKVRLIDDHHKILEKRYPDIIRKQIPAFCQKDPWKVYRLAAGLRLSAQNATVYINIKPETTDVSGAVDYANKEVLELQKSEDSLIIAQYIRGTGLWSLVLYSVDPSMEIRLDDIADLSLLFDLVHVNKVIVNNLAYCETTEKAIVLLTRLRKERAFELTYKFHEYLSVCPSFFLINHDRRPCNPTDLSYCKDCIRDNVSKAVKRDYLAQWRQAFDAFFHVADRCLFFSEYSRDLVCSVYPQVRSKAVVKYHEPLFTGDESKYVQPAVHGQWNIAFVGNFCMEKGSEDFSALKNLMQKRHINARFFVFGENNTGNLLTGMTVLGKYKRENLGALLTKNEIHVVVYPSIANETFSYVAQELMMLHVPLVVYPTGAPQERIRKYRYSLGRIADKVNAESLFDATVQLVSDVYHQKIR